MAPALTRVKILTVCDGNDFWTSIQRIVCNRSADFEAVRSISLSDQELGDPGVALVLLHATQESSVERIAEQIARVRMGSRSVPIIVVSEDSSPRKLIPWLRCGATDCLSAPVDRDRLLFLFESLTIGARLKSQQPAKTGSWYRIDQSEPVCCASPQMSELIAHLEQLAPHQASVMFVGETGTGKTRLARLLHEASPRSREPFVALNCAAMPTTLLESELFGHRKGAFTGADTNHIGKFSHVGSGTLLLDEVDTLSLDAQAKLLRTVDDRMFEPLGSNKSEKFQGRLVVATNQDLRECVRSGKFRADLYFRLNVVELAVPPLRERRDEIGEIADSCIARFASENGTAPRNLSPEVRELLQDYSWPGNVRELQNVMERAMTFSHGSTVRLADLPSYVLDSRLPGIRDLNKEQADRIGHASMATNACEKSSGTLAKARADGERNRLIEALRRNHDNRSRAARELGISRTALYKRLNKYGLVNFSAS